jgi:hypothetical protein
MAQYRGVQVHGVSDQGLAALSFDTWLLLAAKPVVGCACPLPSSPPPPPPSTHRGPVTRQQHFAGTLPPTLHANILHSFG